MRVLFFVLTFCIALSCHASMDVVQERDASNTVKTSNVWGVDISQSVGGAGNIGGLLSRTTYDNGVVKKRYAHHDGRGNIIALTKDGANMTAAQATVARYRYDAYGVILLMDGGAEAESNPYRYQSKRRHSGTSFYDFGFRFYSPHQGRFINRDPIGEAGGVNLYAYAGNSPVIYGDADGRIIVPLAVGIVVVGTAILYPQPANDPTSPIDPIAYPRMKNTPFDFPGGEAATICNGSYFGPTFRGLPTGTQESVRYHERVHQYQNVLRPRLDREVEAYTAERNWLDARIKNLNTHMRALNPTDPRRKDYARRQQEYIERREEVDFYVRNPDKVL